MSAVGKYRLFLIPIFAASVLLSSDSLRSSAFADGPAPTTKGPEVSTVGTDPYIGPLPEELAKLAQLEATPVTSPPPVKEQATATITTGGGNTLTAEELAKLAAFLAVPVTPPAPVMPKLEIMTVLKDGIPQLTAQERDKHARELATPHVLTPPQPAPRSAR